MKKRFCPKCGATEKSFVHGFCRDCFLESSSLIVVPQKLEAVHCKKCDKLLLKGKWFPFSVERIVDWVKEKIKTIDLVNVRFELEGSMAEKGVLVNGRVLGEIEEELFEFPVGIEVKIKDSLCQNCSKLSADYYEAVLQLRFDSLPKQKWDFVLGFAKTIVGELFHRDSLAQVINVQNLKNGFDVYIGSKRAGKLVAEKVASKFEGKITRSFSLAGVDKSGNTRKRFTFLVRL